MDILEFLSRSEWPIVVGGALWFLRRPMGQMIERINLTKIDAWGVKAEFEKGLEKVEALNPPGETFKEADEENQTESGNEIKPEKIDVAGAGAIMYVGSPSMLVLDSWRRLEITLRRLLDQPAGSFKLEDVTKKFALDLDETTSYKTLRNLRNVVAHSNDIQITWEDAARFQQQTYQLINRFEQGMPSKNSIG